MPMTKESDSSAVGRSLSLQPRNGLLVMRDGAVRSVVSLVLVSVTAMVAAPVASAAEGTPQPTDTQVTASPAPTITPVPAPTTTPVPAPTSTSPLTSAPAPAPTRTVPAPVPGPSAPAPRQTVSAAAAAAAKAASDAALARKAAADAAKAGQLPGVVIPEAHTPAEGPFPSKLWGVDVASWQHPDGALLGWGDLAETRSGASFAFVKISEGLDFTNASGVADRAALKAQKTVYGGYHYAIPARPVNSSALAQARFAFAQTGKLTPGQLPMVLDFELNPNALTPQEMATWALTWLKETSRLTGRQSIFYTYPAFFGSEVAPSPELATYPLWIANYGLELSSPFVPAPWTTWTFWQYSSQGRGLPGQVPGTSMDLNVFGGTVAELQAMAGIVTRPHSPAGSAGPAGADMMGDALLRALTAPSPTR